jgi:hypothetical protein
VGPALLPAAGPSRLPRFDATGLAWYAFAPVRRASLRSSSSRRNAWSIAATAIAAVAAVTLTPGEARADVSSWMAVGGGYAAEYNRETATRDFAPTLTYSVGVGSSPLARFVFGGLLRGQTFFGYGTDVGVVARASTGGFARGDWGVAVDAGALWRPWFGGAYGEWPIQAVLTVGAPWGFQVALGTQLSSVSGGQPAQGFFAAVELDLLRLTVMRQGATEVWWPNPDPAGGRIP